MAIKEANIEKIIDKFFSKVKQRVARINSTDTKIHE